MAEFEMGNLYDMNKQLVAKYEKHLRGKALQNKIDRVLLPYLLEKILNSNEYFMLLCHEKRDYTVFTLKSDRSAKEFAELIVENLKICFRNRGKIYGIDKTEDGIAIEFWIKDDLDGEMACYYLFPYSEGIVEV